MYSFPILCTVFPTQTDAMKSSLPQKCLLSFSCIVFHLSAGVQGKQRLVVKFNSLHSSNTNASPFHGSKRSRISLCD